MRKANVLSLLVLAILILSHATLAPVDAGQTVIFEGCGTLIHGVTCILLEVPTDLPPFTTTYIPDDVGDFNVGDRVFVTGDVMGCVSVCQQGSGCLTVASIASCPLPTDTHSFGSIKARFGRD